MSTAQVSNYKEKYSVQVMINHNWQTELSYDLDQRDIALEQARLITVKHPQVPVRVILDAVNNLTKHHSQAIIYKSQALINTLLAKNKVRKVPLSRWEYVQTVINALLMSIVSGLCVVALVHFLMSKAYLYLEDGIHLMILIGVFACVFLGTLHIGTNYIRSHYYFERRKRQSIFSKAKKTFWRCDINPHPSPINKRVRDEMLKAAEAVSHMPVKKHERKTVTPYETMDRNDVVRLFEKSPQKKTSDLVVVPQPDEKAKLFLQTLANDCLIYMKSLNMPLKGVNNKGLCLFIMGAVQSFIKRLNLSEDKEHSLYRSVFGLIGVKDDLLEEFLFDYETGFDNPIDQRLIKKGALTVTRIENGKRNASRDVAYSIQKWKAQHKAYQKGLERPFIMACQFHGPVLDENDQAGEAWPVEWADFLGQFTSYIFDSTENTVVLDFKTAHGVFEASLLIKNAVEALNMQAPEHPVKVQIVITHEKEDEIPGDKALAMIDGVADKSIVFSNEVLAHVEDPTMILWENSVQDLEDEKLFLGFPEEKAQETAPEAPAEIVAEIVPEAVPLELKAL